MKVKMTRVRMILVARLPGFFCFLPVSERKDGLLIVRLHVFPNRFAVQYPADLLGETVRVERFSEETIEA